jgi:hypothetical protein
MFFFPVIYMSQLLWLEIFKKRNTFEKLDLYGEKILKCMLQE